MELTIDGIRVVPQVGECLLDLVKRLNLDSLQLWIFPFQESADVIFNTSTVYELAVLKNTFILC